MRRENRRINYSQTFEGKALRRRAPFIKNEQIDERTKALNDFLSSDCPVLASFS